MAILFVFSLVLLLNSPNSCAAFDYFKFSLQWPEAFCAKNGHPACNQMPNHFTIHGLWPEKTFGFQPHFCTHTKLKKKDIKNLKSDLKLEWPNLRGKKPFKFWSHEWEKHGTCSETVYKPHDYFSLALHIKKNHDVMSILSQAQIVPSQNTTYDGNSIVNAIHNSIHHYPELACYTTQNVTYLWEVRLCLEPNGVSFKDCANHFHNCHNQKDIHWHA
ncbi:hypothetical protein Fmac_021153 [Flemingia macrophylla]|uniref:Uncharacterized protein n=1 Tax=Flemingia macrophylla TaxID=520843 RepID=A0ABD1LWJ6_9FABA